MADAAPEKKRMRKPGKCDACRAAPWPALGVGCPGSAKDAPAELRGVYLWHCGAPACEADCLGRYAGKLRDLGRHDLAARLMGERSLFARPDPAPDAAPSILSPGAALARRPVKSRPAAPVAGQGSLFGA